MDDLTPVIAAIFSGGAGLWAIRIFRTAMAAQAEINAEKNRTIERQATEIKELRTENRRLWEQLAASRQSP